MLNLSVLDQSPIRQGGTAAQAISETVALAKACEALGYARYWVAEHHNSNAFAGTCPEVLIPAIATATSRIRVGSGGVMLSHYAPLKVAEQFRMLETLHPGRIDLGLGRAPGSDQRTSMALQAGPQAYSIDVFPQLVNLVKGFLEDAGEIAPFPADHPYRGIHAMPRGPGMPEMWLLGSGVHSAIYAAELGLAYAHAQFINADGGPEAAAAYRERFKPSARCPEARIALAVFALCAETQAEAERLAATRNLWVLRLLTGQGGAFPSLEEALSYPYTENDRAIIQRAAERGVVGDPAQCHAKLEALAAAYGADELVIVTITYDFADRLRSYRLLAEAMGLPAA